MIWFLKCRYAYYNTSAAVGLCRQIYADRDTADTIVLDAIAYRSLLTHKSLLLDHSIQAKLDATLNISFFVVLD